ncbi:MAG: molybdopterin-binding protein [Bacteroidales bacterium]|jgi:molybdenum cofactor synthesis domain-containing protein|nr:molybdopterin-binding protein [Bacteroidales bacterium]NLM93688.1 molybdenum cofactor synthesis protein [Bacteroidales bacterium]
MKILSVNISEQKGTIKKPVGEIRLGAFGVEEDAHAGNWHRQVSLLGKESVDRFSALAGREITYGEFAENLTTEGLELVKTAPMDRLVGKEVELEITQIGKECHGSSCAIFREVGNCVMPKEGIFARVIRPGVLRPGDELEYIPRVLRFHLITLSDRASRGEYEDRSGPRMVELLEKHFEDRPRSIQIESSIIPDEATALELLIRKSIEAGVDVVITTGGTGVGRRDITVETLKPMLQKEVPGIMEMIRLKYGTRKPNALLSCGIAGFIENTMVYTLPGSVRAVNEYMEEVLKTLEHLIYMRHGLDVH